MKIHVQTNNAISNICAVDALRHRQNVAVQTKLKEVCAFRMFSIVYWSSANAFCQSQFLISAEIFRWKCISNWIVRKFTKRIKTIASFLELED